MCTCEVEACEWEEVLDVMMSQLHHHQADQSPATYHTDRQTERLHLKSKGYILGLRETTEDEPYL